MKFRYGLVVGLGIGYVLGSAAGRERYEQIEQVVRNAVGDDRVDQFTAKGKAVADLATERTRGAVSTGLETVSTKMRRSAEQMDEVADDLADAADSAAPDGNGSR